ncbi:MAG: ferrous iron transport protein A [Planctomycetes bacterium]|nr:ferrous iron transport protein A [Planctomycetota bacterium]
MLVSLGEMNVGQAGVIRQVLGGRGFVRRLEVLGIRPGKSVAKTSAHMWAGPVLVQVDGRTIALGSGMARRVLVEVPS